jgi:hypothetical protein
MIDQIILMIAQGKVGWVLFGAIGTVAMVFAVYYISFALYLIFASMYSGFKLIPGSYRIWREDMAAAYDISWGRAQLGVTMPDGGEPVEKEEQEKEEEEEKEKEA